MDFAKFIKEEDYLPQQVFNCDETGLFWKKMPRRTYITQDEEKMTGHKPMKGRLTLLFCANTTSDLKIKPLLVYHSHTPRPFQQEKVMEWLYEVFAPTVKKYLSDNQFPD